MFQCQLYINFYRRQYFSKPTENVVFFERKNNTKNTAPKKKDRRNGRIKVWNVVFWGEFGDYCEPFTQNLELGECLRCVKVKFKILYSVSGDVGKTNLRQT